ncbi:type VI secretion system protein ImpL [Paraburkholderia sp. JPY158]|uniref:Type VI secretion system protein ImpL n=1 Tax=Paraburkholderia atlantica TaxID=2654982 RepID=A0A7W8V3Z5_PARAM|nr:ImcF-related family protein [Paraburkholderia atlantica]MBB5422291.1 type VI secretion system protein ImpL [Paraburkholderia atlantica]
MSEHKSEPVALFIGIGICILFVALGLTVWLEGPAHGWTQETRIIIELCLLSGMLIALMLVKYFEAVVLWIASMRATQWFARYDSKNKRAQGASEDPALAHFTAPENIVALREALRALHGRHWRYRDRWLLLTGDLPVVKRLAPGLAETGYVITGNTVLLYAAQTSTTLDTTWLTQIRRLRRRRPIDAIVALTRNRSSANSPFDADALAQRLACHARALRWSAPAYLLNVTDFSTEPKGDDEAIGLTWSNARVHAAHIDDSLQNLTRRLADAGVLRLADDKHDRYPAELSQHIERLSSALSGLVAQTAHSRYWRQAVHGLLFAPLFKERELAPPATPDDDKDNADEYPGAERMPPQHRTLWQTIADHSLKLHGRRIGFSLSTTAAWTATAAIALWITGTMISGLTNRGAIQTAADTLTKLAEAHDPTRSIQTLDTLDKQIDTLESHQLDGAPHLARFGLNRDTALLNALWPSYENAAGRILVAPIRDKLEARLHRLASLTDAEIASGGSAEVQAAYDTLKTYMMLARPERAVTAFLAPQLTATSAPARPADSPLSAGAWEDLRQHTIAFFANHRGRRASTSGSPLAIVPDSSLISATRQTIIGVRGIQNSTDAVYQQILDDAKAKYPPVPLATLLGDTSSRGLFSTTATVPGVFTRAAWEERIAKAIDDASEHSKVTGDWVLSDVENKTELPSSLKAELRQRYFDDYARAWGLFLNSLRWQAAPTLSATADQLTLLGDPQRSPLVMLMNAIVYQAGTGARTPSLSDTLVSKAQQLVGADQKNPAKQTQPPLAPLAVAFGPILRLAGSDLASGATRANAKGAAQLAATGDLTVARYLERVTAMRLKIEQIVSSPDTDAMSRIAAQAVLQGKTSDIADSRDYASRLAASLGERWAGFGALFQAPLDQTWRVLVQPAAASLNEIWRTAIVADWNSAFGGRYPFADSDNDASLPEMARFMRPDNGVITQFVTTQLAGVVERQGDRWIAAQSSSHGGALTLDPGFLDGLNKMTRASTVLFPSGDAHVRYELRAVPTPGITDMRFVLSGREMHYFNQKEEWKPFLWPGDSLDNLSHIEWQTEQGGLRSALDAQGRFGLIRLLERAQMSQQDAARYVLSWQPDQSEGIPLRVQLRSEAGSGPLEVLSLRHFKLPARIFVTGNPKSAPKPSEANPPPPLPPSALNAAKHAAVGLPQGSLPEVE